MQECPVLNRYKGQYGYLLTALVIF
jgi:hypothetical protein